MKIGDKFGGIEIPDNNPVNSSSSSGIKPTGFSGLDHMEPGSLLSIFSQAGTGASQDIGLPNLGSWQHFYQGSSNGCGTTSLAMIMTYLGVPETKDSIDSVIRRTNIFSSPGDLIEFARDHGLEAEGYNNGSVDELKGFVQNGFPVQCMIDAKGNGNISDLHYVDVVGFRMDTTKTPPQEMVQLQDPAKKDGGITEMPRSEFEKKWDVGFGFHNYFNAYGPSGAHLPPGRDQGMESSKATVEGITNITNGWDRIFGADDAGDVAHGIFELPGGIGQTIGGFVGGLFQLGGQGLNDLVDGVPVLQDIVKPFGSLLNMGGAVIGDAANAFGECLDDVGGSFDCLFDGDIGGFFGGLWEAAYDDIGGGLWDIGGDIFDGASEIGGEVLDTAESIGEGISDGAEAVGGAISDGAEAVGGAISDGVEAVGDFFDDLW